MGYSTTLYAISLERLSSAIGSKDEALLEKINRETDVCDRAKNNSRTVRLIIDDDGAILLDGEAAEIEEVVAAVRSLTGEGDNVRVHTGRSNRGRVVMPKVYEAAREAFKSSGNHPEFFACSRNAVWEDDDVFFGESTEEHEDAALRAVVFDNHDNQEAGDLAYALEKICAYLGEELETDDTLGDLEPLQLDTPLLKWRMPVDLPSPTDFPFVSYLTSEEASAEADRLASLDLSYPDDEDIENARQVLALCLKQAQAVSSAVIAFYY